ncbi:hypothetical protein BD770DRAFT_449658 [Pilaira anomala]|nr:hypothetical protein BD770DRAFT_449658 [Pilaira anomala]
MNYIEDKTSENTGIVYIGMMPATSWKDDEEGKFFNGKKELFWEFALEAGIVDSVDDNDLVENQFHSFWYVLNEALRSFKQVPEEEINEGLNKIKQLIKETKPRTVVQVGKAIPLHWWGRGIPCGPMEREGGRNDPTYYVLPSTAPNSTYKRGDIWQEFVRFAAWLNEE